jgi:hypothetical protein
VISVFIFFAIRMLMNPYAFSPLYARLNRMMRPRKLESKTQGAAAKSEFLNLDVAALVAPIRDCLGADFKYAHSYTEHGVPLIIFEGAPQLGFAVQHLIDTDLKRKIQGNPESGLRYVWIISGRPHLSTAWFVWHLTLGDRKLIDREHFDFDLTAMQRDVQTLAAAMAKADVYATKSSNSTN